MTPIRFRNATHGKKMDNLDLLDQICYQKVQSKTNEHYRQVQHIWITLGSKVHLYLTILLFGTNLSIKGYHLSERKKLNIIEFNISAKFHLKLTILIFRIKFAKINNTNKFRIFHLAVAPSFTLTDNFSFLDQNFLKRHRTLWF